MISKKNFFTISVMMVVVFFLFMVTGGAKLALSNYEKNEYSPNNMTVEDTSADEENNSKGILWYLGDDGDILLHLKEYAYYNKNTVVEISHGGIQPEDEETHPSMLVIDGASLTEDDVDFLMDSEASLITMVFASVPSNEFLKEHTDVANLMGIRAIQSESTALLGMHLYEGFLLGGEKIYELGEDDPQYYQDLNLRVPWYILESATKVYMSGYLNKTYKDADISYTPPIIWRNNLPDSYVYVINSDFMEDISALGIYTAIMTSLDEITAYAVINSQNMVLYNYPTFANENEDKIKELYSRDTINYLETLVWPMVTSVSSANKLKPSFMISAKLDYSSSANPQEKALNYLMELVRECHGEAGLSLKAYSDISSLEKIAYDLNFFGKELEKYDFYSCYIGDLSYEEAKEALQEDTLEKIAVLLADPDKGNYLIETADNNVILAPTTSSQYYSFRKDFTLKSVETALGYSMAAQNMGTCVYPQTKEAHLQNFSEDYSGTMNTLYEAFSEFDATTVTEAGNRVKNYLNLDYEVSVSLEKDRVTITTNTYGDGQYFILKTPNMEIASISEGEYKELEDGVYLLSLKSSQTTIDLQEEKNSLLKYFR